jgi:D-3-phosphoglycerate dehydrogenase / 2-oxoglutarate reductase
MPKEKPIVLLVEKIHPKYHALLEKRCRIVRPIGFTENELAQSVRDVDAILIRTKGCVSAKIIAAATKLKVIARHGVGVDHIDLRAAAERGIPVVYTPAGSLTAVAEHTWMMILALAKHTRQGDQAVRTCDYEQRSRGENYQLEDKTLGVVGLGRIGGRVAEIARTGFRMNVLYTDLLRYPAKERKLEARKVPLKQLLQRSDVITIHVPLTRLTRGMIDREQIALLQPHAFLINCARGAILNTVAAAEALNAGKLGGVGVDVFDPEIPPADHPLLRCAHAILSPHNAAQTAEARLNYAAVVVDLLRVLDGKKPEFVASPEE